MKTELKPRETAQEILYATIGAGEIVADKVRSLKRFGDAEVNRKVYKDVVGRGRKVSRKVRTSAPGKQIVARTEDARKQVQDATKAVGKAFGVNVVSWPQERTGRRTSSPAKKSTTRKATRKSAAKAS